MGLKREEDNQKVFVGGKSFMNYVNAVATQFLIHKVPEVTVLGRGKFISRAVDVVQVVREKTMKDGVVLESVKIDSETLPYDKGDPESREIRVSTIELTLKKVF